MQKRSENSSFLGIGENILAVLDTMARVAFWGGALATLIGVGFLIFNFSAGSSEKDAEILKNIQMFGPMALYGSIAIAAGAAWLFWGEEILGILLLIGGGAIIFAPTYIPMMMGGSQAGGDKVLAAIGMAGIAPAIAGVIVIILDVITRIKTRMHEGKRAEQLKYGKGVKEEKDIKNVFLGKCWQLPYCRKFVRERCPIYHTRRTCWKERVGCMCEETVINNAMAGKTIPSDIVAAAKFIPQNNKLTEQQKAARCQQCVIYNEHQKHVYKTTIPIMGAAMVGIYFLVRVPFAAAVLNLLNNANDTIKRASLGKSGTTINASAGGFGVHDFLVIAIMFVVFAYLVRFVESVFFKSRV